ncbi:hypothetical protein JW916_13995 [Candidatus Sumerlaeota bacterium]|nr:hypothetical protein [Candidatus Sumerlaeota bacterium]
MRNTVALVLAGGMNLGFSVLTHNRAKSALPFCGHYRIIDSVLTNLSKSGIQNVGVIIQYLPGSLIDHIGMGQAWDFDTTNRHIKLMPPFVGMGKTEWFRGTADAVYRNMNLVSDSNADLVLVLSADHIYTMDYGPMIEFHRRSNADLTIMTTRRPKGVAPEIFGYVTFDKRRRVTRFEEKPLRPPHDTISTGVYLFDAQALGQRLEALQEGVTSHNLPTGVIVPLVNRSRVYAYPFKGRWEYLPNLESYVALHREVLDGAHGEFLIQSELMTNMRDRDLGSRPSPYFGRLSEVRRSLVSPGCVVEGTISNCVLSPGVCVAPNAVVTDSILFHDCRVEEGAHLSGVVSDKDAVYHPYCEVGKRQIGDEPISSRDMVVVGKGAEIVQGVQVAPGNEIPIKQVVSRDWVQQREEAVS